MKAENKPKKSFTSTMGNNKKIKFKILLPDKFQEVLISWEMKFEKGNRELVTIRNILYMYSVSNLFSY